MILNKISKTLYQETKLFKNNNNKFYLFIDYYVKLIDTISLQINN